MHIAIEAAYDPARYADVFRHMLRDARRRVWISGAIMVVLGGVVWLASWPAGLFFVLLGVLFVTYLPHRMIRASVQYVPPLMRESHHIELTEQYVRITVPLALAQYAWGAFERIDEGRGHILLMISKRQGVPVPIAGLPPEQLAELRQFLAARAAGSPQPRPAA